MKIGFQPDKPGRSVNSIPLARVSLEYAFDRLLNLIAMTTLIQSIRDAVGRELACRLTLGALLFVPGAVSAADTGGNLEYNRDIRPILAENCFACHGPDSAARKAGLRLDRFDDATAPRKDKQPAIVPGKPAASALVGRITAAKPDDVMPPAQTHKCLTAAEKATLTAWITAGAKYQAHWSLLAPHQAPLPTVRDTRWPRNAMDHFILARLEREGLQPAPEADRRTLIRRVSLDLTGLPPTSAEVEAFVSDPAPDAYERVVDRMLASPRWGEHRARYWLDAARYADSNGIHFDNFREMWAYRDWVIKAFNRNEHFDQFTIEQLAGDLLPNRTLENQVASGFNRCNMTSNEGGAIDEEYLVLYARDRTEATSQVWLGTTAGCSVCHDHKFDPLPQKDFYSMAAFFNNTTQRAMDGNVKDTPPVVVVPQEGDRPRWERVTGEVQAAKKRVENRREGGHKDFEAWIATAKPDVFAKQAPTDVPLLQIPLADHKEKSLAVSVKGECRDLALAEKAEWQAGAAGDQAFTIGKAGVEVPGVGDLESDQAFSYGAWVRLDQVRDGALFARMDDQHDYRGWDLWLEGGRPGAHIISKWQDDALKVVSNKAIEAKRWTHVFVTYDGSRKAGGVKVYLDGESQAVGVQADQLKGSIRTTVPFKIGQRHASSPVTGAALQDLRIYGRALTAGEVKSLARDSRMAALLTKAADQRTDKEKDELYRAWLNGFDTEFPAANTRLAALQQEENEIKRRGTAALVMQEKSESALAYILFRGDYDKRRDKVEPNTPAALPPLPADFPRNRLGFARWLLQPEHPLTARVTVNRFWQELFGTGIVKSSGDFGVAGELPSHQDLLDWLAVDFRQNGWDIKRLFKQIVLSATYRQSSVVSPASEARDPQNRLLSHGPRYRMDAEMVRDYALAVSGLLSPRIGGPSVRPYQPEGVWEAVAMPESNTRNYKPDTGESLYRRSLYTFWKRAAPPASLEVFNAPSRETCIVRRERTDTPLQALVTLNDPQFVEAARNLAQCTLQNGGATATDRLDFMARRLLARPLRPAEQRILTGAVTDLLDQYHANPKAAEELLTVGESKADPALDHPLLAAYTMVANEMLNLDEVLNK